MTRKDHGCKDKAEEDYEEEVLNVTLPATYEMRLPSGEPQQSSLELTIEFLCTYQCPHGGRPIKDAADVRPDSTLTFSLSGRAFTLSMAEFGHRLGIYTEEEARSLVFAALPYSLPSESSGKSHRKTIQAGPFVSRLARSLLPEMSGNLLPIDLSIRPLSTTSLTKMGMAKRHRVEDIDEPPLDFFDGLDTTVHSPLPDATIGMFVDGGSSSSVHPGTYTASEGGIDPSIFQSILEEMRKLNTRMNSLETNVQDARDVMETEFASHTMQFKRMNERLESNTEQLLGLEMMLGKKFAPTAPSSRASHHWRCF
ncbi:unnamed protein product [Cuscuta campestris]|uniref:Uncharacterized protein n=1 Tax=Cuscuta campestris TaxID=132261 RepID=A0A484LNI3_9ASTE|nr:unnamed protein product [Cuscuta campestris]